jgi:tRNA1(Val) A37 N6-methylase TrmN6
MSCNRIDLIVVNPPFADLTNREVARCKNWAVQPIETDFSEGSDEHEIRVC